MDPHLLLFSFSFFFPVIGFMMSKRMQPFVDIYIFMASVALSFLWNVAVISSYLFINHSESIMMMMTARNDPAPINK